MSDALLELLANKLNRASHIVDLMVQRLKGSGKYSGNTNDHTKN
jgi:hypothetical protein